MYIISKITHNNDMGGLMKNMLKAAAVGAAMAFVGTSAYMLGNDKLRKKTGKKVIKAMDNAEEMIAKKMY